MTGADAGAAGLRVGVDVGGTFTKAVAVAPVSHELHAEAVVPTTHEADHGVAEGVAQALRHLAGQLGEARRSIDVVAFSTTQAMNALLEGDVGRVGVIGLGEGADVRTARRRTRIGGVALAPGHELRTHHEFLDATGGLHAGTIDAAVDRLANSGCTSVAVSGAFSVDAPGHELEVGERVRAAGLPVCMGHELTGAYGLETRTLSAAINASILPVVQRTAAVVESALADAQLGGRLLVLRGDGGAMSVEAFRRAPTFTIGSGPAAGVAAALHQLRLHDAIVLECGGTSSNVSLVRNGRTVLRSLRVMGRPTSIRAVDSWVVGVGGGSLARLRRRRLVEVGPRSAHVAGLPYACFANPVELEGAEAHLIAPRPGDPDAYATVSTAHGRYALTVTCAANALDLLRPGAYAQGSREAALAGFEALGARIGRRGETVARSVLDGALDKLVGTVAEAARRHDLAPDAPLVVLGGAGEALAGEMSQLARRPLLLPRHPEVLSSVGAALSLVSAEVTRTAGPHASTVAVAREAERACVDAGAAPSTVAVDAAYEPREGVVRARATGSVALEAGAADRDPVDQSGQLRAAAAALQIDPGRLSVAGATDFYRVFSENGSGHVAVVDGRGAVPLAANARRVLAGRGETLLAALDEAVRGATMHLGVAMVPPRVALISGAHIIDLSSAHRPEEILSSARAALDAPDGPAVAVIWR